MRMLIGQRHFPYP